MTTQPSPQIAALRSLKATLEDLRARGRENLWISPEAIATLTSLRGRIASTAAPAPPAPEEPAAADLPPAAPRAAAIRPTVKSFETGLQPAGETAAEKLASLEAMAADWRPARDLGTLRDTMVFAVGNPEAALMFVGEAPGAEEERKREPFVGKAGQLLDKILQAMGLDRGGVYISNICKFRPAIPGQGQGTANRKPTSEEMEACRPFVLAEIEIVRPRAIVALGASAAEGLLGLCEPVGKIRSRFHDLNGVPVMVTYHPSYLLRNPDLAEKRKLWEDMLLVMEKLGMLVSERQRSFFLK